MKAAGWSLTLTEITGARHDVPELARRSVVTVTAMAGFSRSIGSTPRARSSLCALVLVLLCAVLVGCGGSSPKAARLPALHSGRVGPVSMFTIASQLTSAPRPTLTELKRLGVDRVHVYMSWSSIAPDPAATKQPAFDASDPSAYPAAGWAPYDTVVRGLAARHMGIDLALAGAPPVWAEAPGGSKYDHNENDYEPSAAAYKRWVTAVARRYSGHYTPPRQSSPLPRVNFWSVWNEPNLGTFLAPETAHGGAAVEIAPRFYRGLVDGAWKALHATGHGSDTLLIGELAPIGNPGVGVFNVMAPLRFLRALYCVDANLRQLRGTAATARGCPATAGGSARFAADNPGLFHASGFADHPYPYGLPPDKASPGGPDDTDLAQIPNLESLLDRVNHIYGSSTRFPIWSTEFGYETNPPNPVTVPMKTAALYLNWAEYLTWSNPRIKSYDQYLLNDPPTTTGFTTGLNFYSGKRKLIYAAYRMPLYLPVSTTTLTQGHPLIVWGDVRPAADAAAQTHKPEVVQVQFQPVDSGAFKTVQHVTVTRPHGYFEVRQTFPTSGQVRLTWSYPNGETIYSRTASITIH
jgi:hypothetical protein